MASFNRAALAALAADLPAKDITVRGGAVRIRMLTGGAKDRIESATTRIEGATVHRDLSRFRTFYIAHSVCDDDGALLYDAAREADLAEIEALPGDVSDALFQGITAFNKMRPEDQETALKN